jgi:hypothetical protein
MIKFIFVTGEEFSGLAYDSSHCVPGLTLPLGDANFFFINAPSLPGSLKKKITYRVFYLIFASLGYGILTNRTCGIRSFVDDSNCLV